MKPVILVTGGTGFIGKVVVARLRERGYEVRVMSRRPVAASASERTAALAGAPGYVTGDMRDAASLREAARGVDAIVHLAAAKSDEPDSDDVNVEGARRLAALGCRRIINISTQSTKIARKGTYARTKLAADEILHASGLDVTTLMPSIVYGEELAGVFGTVLGFIQKLPIVPVLGDGQWISAPIHVRDVADAVIACLETPATIGKRYDLGGPDQISFDELIDRLAAGIGKRAPKFHIPFGVSLLAAKIVTKLLPKPPITVSNVLGSNQNTNIDITPARRDFGFNPVSLAEGLPAVLAPLQPSEAKLLAHHLLGVELPAELRERYDRAARPLADAPELRFIRRHPWALGFVNTPAVRQRLVLMTAILEATPRYADFFLAQPRLGEVFGHGCRAVAKLILGWPITRWARRM